MGNRSLVAVMVGVALLWAPSGAGAVTPAEKCESSKIKEAGKYGFCRLKAESKAVKTASTPDYSKCDAKYGTKWPSIELGGGGMCPSNGDQMAIKSFITQCSDNLAAALAGGTLPECAAGGVLQTGQTTSYGPGTDGDLQNGAGQTFTDNGDGTITDNTTGLMWEKKSDDGSIHDKDALYRWCLDTDPFDLMTCDNVGYPMDGSIVTTFLATLNSGSGFAGHTDWRIPNIKELHTLTNFENVAPAINSLFNVNCAPGCTVTTCSCTSTDGGQIYWSSSTLQESPNQAWWVDFWGGAVNGTTKTDSQYVRAVRGGS